MDWDEFAKLLGHQAKVAQVERSDVLFRSGLDMASVAFTEFIMDFEERTGADVDMDTLDASIVTAGQLYDRLCG